MHPFRRLKLWANDVALTRINAITDYFIATILEPALNPIDVRNKIDAAVERMVNSSSAADYLKNMTTREQHAMIQEAMNVRCKELLVHAEHVGLHIINEPDLQRAAETAVFDTTKRVVEEHLMCLEEFRERLVNKIIDSLTPEEIRAFLKSPEPKIIWKPDTTSLGY